MIRHAPSIGLGIGLSLRGSGGVGFSGLLDQYGGASAAYSLRSLSSGWLAGDVVEVRRDADGATGIIHKSFTGGEINSGAMLAWVTEFSGTANGFVSTWYDQSGFANNATQATTTAQPKIVDAGALVTGGIEFDGVDDLLSNGSLTLGATVTAYSVTNSTAKGNSSFIYSINGTSGIVDFTDPSGFASIFAGTSLKASTDISGVDVLKSSLFNGANSNIRVNGASVVTGTSSTQLANGTLVIGGGGSVPDRMLGTIKEIIIYDSDQSANRTGIEANINAAYSIY